jgi:nicotinate dehydrogenase subunit A
VQSFEFQVNGKARAHEGLADDKLLTVLHEQGLTATKLGCGASHCGACAVWVDGQVMHACDVPIWSVQANAHKLVSDVVTLEGLAASEPKIALVLRAAFEELQAAQCGYCLSGILMQAAALLKSAVRDHVLVAEVVNEVITEQAIVQALDSHLCRCGSHQRIVKAIMLAASRL